MNTETVICLSCGYTGGIDTYAPCLSVYNDCSCPKCGSTNNEHNAEYQRRVAEGMRQQNETNAAPGGEESK